MNVRLKVEVSLPPPLTRNTLQAMRPQSNGYVVQMFLSIVFSSFKIVEVIFSKFDVSYFFDKVDSPDILIFNIRIRYVISVELVKWLNWILTNYLTSWYLSDFGQ